MTCDVDFHKNSLITLLGQLFWVDLIKWVSIIRPYVCPYVRPSVQKSLFDFNEILCAGSGQWVMHDGMLYDPIEGHGQGHEPFKVANPFIFTSYLPISSAIYNGSWQLTTDS